MHHKVQIPKVRGVDSWDGWIQGTLEEDIDECSVIQSAGGDEDDSRGWPAFGSRREREEMEEQWLRSGGELGGHPMWRRSQMKAAEKPQGEVMRHPSSALGMPLVVAAGGERRYKPYGVGDVTSLAQMLPPIIDGGAGWLRQLDKVTSGTQLALGDFRAIAGRCMTVTTLEEIQVLAAVTTRPDSTPFFRVQEQIGNAVRQQYPTPNASAIIKLEWNLDQNSRDYVEQVKEKWLQNTGYNPSTRGLHQVWFRQAVLEGVPEQVREKFLDDPDLEGADAHRWERHLVHHLDKYKQIKDKKRGVGGASGTIA